MAERYWREGAGVGAFIILCAFILGLFTTSVVNKFKADSQLGNFASISVIVCTCLMMYGMYRIITAKRFKIVGKKYEIKKVYPKSRNPVEKVVEVEE